MSSDKGIALEHKSISCVGKKCHYSLVGTNKKRQIIKWQLFNDSKRCKHEGICTNNNNKGPTNKHLNNNITE